MRSSSFTLATGLLLLQGDHASWAKIRGRDWGYLLQPRLIWLSLSVLLVLYCLLMSNVLYEHRSKFLEMSSLHNQLLTGTAGGGGGAAGGAAAAAAANPPDPVASLGKPVYFANYTEGAPTCRPITPDEVAFTLVTQTSANRLWMIQDHCERWGVNNPISLAVYSTDTSDTLKSTRERLEAFGCRNVTLQLLSDGNSTLKEYPINVLRNMALRGVKTTHLAYVDMDFWPSRNLHHNLMKRHVREHVAADDRAGIVIPAFMYIGHCPSKRCRPLVPGNYTELLALLASKKPPKVDRFDHRNGGAHGSTNYKAWVESQTASELVEIPCTESNRYEPYLALRWCEKLPPFQEAFTGYGKNKITWIMHLRRAGWTMQQLGESFLVHFPHRASDARLAWDGGPKTSYNPNPDRSSVDLHRYETDRIFIQFKRWLMTEVPEDMRLPACEAAEQDDSRLWTESKLIRKQRTSAATTATAAARKSK
jgi:Glycosyl-transferase for dystroglycan